VRQVGSEIPSLRQISCTAVPLPACLRAKAICSSQQRIRFMALGSPQDQCARKVAVRLDQVSGSGPSSLSTLSDLLLYAGRCRHDEPHVGIMPVEINQFG
jgi:hypothetical protein